MGSWLILALVCGGYLLGLTILAICAFRVVALENAADARAYRSSRQPPPLLALDRPRKGDRRAA